MRYNELLEENTQLIEDLQKSAARLTVNPSFKAWFKGSKVVDDKKQPLVCYHITAEEFSLEEIQPLSHFGTISAIDDFFHSYSFRMGEMGRVFPVFLDIKNPMKIHDDGRTAHNRMVWGNILAFDMHYSDYREPYDTVYFGDFDDNLPSPKFEADYNEFKRTGEYATTDLQELIELNKTKGLISIDEYIQMMHSKNWQSDVAAYARRSGYDGFYYVNAFEGQGSISWVITDPKQVKSVFENKE